jgi:hypothetical protein
MTTTYRVWDLLRRYQKPMTVPQIAAKLNESEHHKPVMHRSIADMLLRLSRRKCVTKAENKRDHRFPLWSYDPRGTGPTTYGTGSHPASKANLGLGTVAAKKARRHLPPPLPPCPIAEAWGWGCEK